MGSSCDSACAPSHLNECSCDINDVLYGENTGVNCFCAPAGSAGDDDREDYCGSIGNDEWHYTGATGGGCTYNSCYEGTFMGDGCCDGCCGITGQSVTCVRKEFRGHQNVCCWKDFICKPLDTIQCSTGRCAPNSCFSDANRSNTCHPDYRDMTSSSCQDNIFDYCTGLGDDTKQWLNRWTEDGIVIGSGIESVTLNKPCLTALYRNLYSDKISGGYCGRGVENSASCNAIPGVGIPSASGLDWSRKLMSQVFGKYVSQGGRPDAQEGDLGSNPAFNKTLYEICKTTPALCDQSLRSYCSYATTRTLVNHIQTLNWCGCYMDDGQYDKYTNLYQINKECTPTCNQSTVISLPSDSGAGKKVCQQSLCIIDDISIELVNSRVGDSGTGINFSQMCSSCGGGTTIIGNETDITSSTCSCIISNNTFKSINSSISSINIQQSCGEATCYAEKTINGKQQIIPVACDSGNSSTDPFSLIALQEQQVLQSAINTRNNYVTLVIFLVIVVIIIIWLILSPQLTPDKNLIIERKARRATQKELNSLQSFEDYRGISINDTISYQQNYNSI